MRSGGMFVLPSGRTLQYYKNSVSQATGFNDEILNWMALEAKGVEAKPDNYCGGLLLDDMSIQEDVTLKKVGNSFIMLGNVDVGETSNLMNIILEKNTEAVIAKYTLSIYI